MLIKKHKHSFRITFMTLAFGLMLLAEPIVAEPRRNESSKSSGSSPTTQQAKKASAVSKTRRPLHIKSRAPIMTRLSKARIRPSITKTLSQSNLRRIAKPTRGISQLNRAMPIRRPSRPTLSRTPTLRSVLRSTAESKHRSPSGALGRPSSRVPTGVSPSVRKRTVISSNKTSRIGGLIGKQKRSVPIVAKSSAVDQSKGISSGNRINSIRTSRIASSIIKQRPSVSTIRRQPSINRSSPINSDRTQRLSSLIGKEKTSIPIIRRLIREGEPKRSTSQTRQSSSSGALRTLKVIGKKPAERRAEAGRARKRINLRVVDRLRPSPRPTKPVPENQTNVTNVNVVNHADVRLSPEIHRGRLPAARNIHRHEHVYWDRYNRLCHRIVWPRYRFAVCYSYGPYFTFRYIYPYYLRRYIFVSLGGYWPVEYRYIRYYWYGCHPYQWYGYYPIGYEVKGDTYHYYTYNYYYNDDDTVAFEPGQLPDGIKPVDHNTFADVREKLAQPTEADQEPHPETLADTYFDEAVKAFEAGSYEIAIEKFAEATELASDDMVLPFAYSQALFAKEHYSDATKVLRTALAKVSAEKEGVFYPRGLYSNDDILFEQIERLSQKAELHSSDADLQLLLGYHLLGIGEIDKAIEPLERASQDLENAAAATTLLDLLAKIKTDTDQ